MGNQLTGIAPSQIQPVEHYLTDITDYQYLNSLGSTRFFKVAKAKTKEGLIVVKVFVIHDPSLPLSSHRQKLEDINIRLQGTSNCLPFQKSIQSDKAALIFRQYVKDSLYDRISTRPFLNKIEKKWLAFQLLCALNQCHKIKVCHGDIKAENVMITSWNWLLLTDFASFKPTYLPEDNPSDFSYFFDTSRRRICYISPERFVESGFKSQESQGQTGMIDLTYNAEVKKGDLTPAMDIFSAGCVISELFTEGTPPFDFSQLLAYRNGEYSPWKVLEKIDDNFIRDLVRHMIKKDPSHRLSAEEYMIQQRGKAFPEYFYTFLKLYLQRFASSPILPADDRINRIKRDFNLIVKNLCPKDERSEENVGLVLIISLIGSSARKLHFCNSRLTALQLLLDVSKFVTTDIILDRIIPYLLSFANDQFPRVRAEVVRVVTQCLTDIDSIPRGDANVFPEYIFPNITQLTQDPVVMVRAAYAENIAQLAETALRVLEMTQRRDIEENEDEEDGILYQASYDMELLSLQETIQQKVVTLLSDPDNNVKQMLLENGITRLCVFFGRQKANDVLLSHMITFLNDKTDWHLRGSFFANIIGVAAYVGWQSCSILKPLLDQGLSDPEEFVVYKALGALQALTELGLIQKAMLQEFLHEVVPFLAHPGIWIRQGAVGFISTMTRTLNIADIHCKVLPLLQPCLKQPVLQIDKEIFVLNALQNPIPRPVFDYVLRVNQIERLFDILRERQYMRSIIRPGHRINYPELDETMSQVFKKLTSFGMDESHEDKIYAMKDYMNKLHRARAGSVDARDSQNKLGSTDLDIGDSSKHGSFCIVGPGKSITRRHAELIKQKDLKQTGVDQTPTSRKSKKAQQQDTSSNMNSEWKSMFGSSESDTSTISSSPKVRTQQKSAETLERKLNVSQTSSQSSSSGSFVTMSPAQISSETSIKSFQEKSMEKTSITRYHTCKIELRNLVHKKRDLYSADVLSKDLLENIAWESRPPPSNWKPKGLLVAHLQEHRGAVNRIQVSHDHSFFATASNDGTVKLWESEKLEGNSVANRSKQTLKNVSIPGEKVQGLVFCEGSLSLASYTDQCAIHVYKIETGKASLTKDLNVDKQDMGNIVDITHFDTGAHSVLSYATVNGFLIGLDLRSNKEVWKLRNDPKSGLITSFAVHHSQCWLAVGTSSGTHVCWDMRFQLPITSIVHPTGARVRRLMMHPQEQSWLISATQGNNEVSIWDVETGARQKALWASPTPALSLNQASHHSVYGMHIAVTDTNVFMLTAGSDMRARFWDVSYPANSFILAGAASDPVQQTGVSYRSRLVDGVEVIQETYSKKQVSNEDIPRRGPEAPAQGHRDIISDINLCQTSQCLVITGSRDGVVKVWK